MSVLTRDLNKRMAADTVHHKSFCVIYLCFSTVKTRLHERFIKCYIGSNLHSFLKLVILCKLNPAKKIQFYHLFFLVKELINQ